MLSEKRFFLISFLAIIIFLFLITPGCKSSGGDGKLPLPDHPRLILNGDFLKLTRERCRASRADLFQDLKKSAENYLAADPDSLPVRDAGRLAEKCAFIYLIEGDKNYLSAGLRFLDRALDRYLKLEEEQGGGYWEAVEFRRYSSFAYDWMYQAMSGEERKRFGDKIAQAGRTAWKRSEKWYSPYDGGGYGSLDPMFWPAVALAGTGVDDSLCSVWFEWTRKNIHEWRRMQAQVAADDGGMYSGMAYAAYNYLRTPIYDFEIWKNLTGEDLAQDNPYLQYFSVWWLYCLKPNGEWLRVDDAGSVKGSIHPWHFKYLASRYRDSVSTWYLENLAEKAPLTVWDVLWDPADLDIPPAGPDKTWPLARHFEGLGWVIMRSGWKPEATHAFFDCGPFYYGHQHAAENSFVIFKKGNLAINSGRYEWESNHRPNYTARTIAANTILVYDPREEFKGDNGELLSNDGGQAWPIPSREKFGETRGTVWDKGEITAFETNPYYSYVSGDASRAYNPQKLTSFTRQFIHFQPDLFVVFDRVEATDQAFKKFWLLHSINEPVIKGKLAETGEREGRLFCRTVFPRDARVQKVGGPGHEFEVFGTNYPPSVSYYPKASGEEWGSWRIEVTPGRPRVKDYFLNVLLAQDSSKAKAPDVKPLEEKGDVGVEVNYNGRLYRVMFRLDGPPGGYLTITGLRDIILVEKELSETVQPQTGIGK